jgi:hypothetical protein
MGKTNKAIRFSLLKVNTDQFAVFGDIPKKEDLINFSTNFNFGIKSELRQIGVFVKFSFENSNVPFIQIEASCHFRIIEDDWKQLINEENTSIKLPKNFASHLLMITVGTVRGILHSKTENTPFNVFHIPLLNLVDMVKSDIILNL